MHDTDLARRGVRRPRTTRARRPATKVSIRRNGETDFVITCYTCHDIDQHVGEPKTMRKVITKHLRANPEHHAIATVTQWYDALVETEP